jgi:Ser/Thr protein kinase RdoA (MazF antagonist)
LSDSCNCSQSWGGKALSRWGLEGAELQLLNHRENTAMKATAPSGDCYAMRIHRLAYRGDADLLSELQWLESLRAAAIATTEARRALDDSLFVSVGTAALPEGRQCDLLAWVPGSAIGSVEEGVAFDESTLTAVYLSAGELAARIHNHGETWQRPPGFTRLSWDEDGFFGESGSVCGRYWDLAVLTPDQLALLHRARDVCAAALCDFGKSADRDGLVHGDMLPENLFYDGAGLRLIDWDDTGFGWHLYDFATAMFEGYRCHRALPDDHLEILPVLVMARALSYVGWAHTRRETGGEVTPLIIDVACELAQQLLTEQSLP